MNTRFIQIHTLTSYAASLLNRDDAGFAKRLPFGGAVRTRISSQCLKRHWRRFEGKHALSSLGVPMSVRSRYTLERMLVQPLHAEDKIDETLARVVVTHLADEVLGKSEKAKAKEEAEVKKQSKRVAERKEGDAESESLKLRTEQLTILGGKELDFLRKQARAIAKAAGDPGKVKEAAKTVLGKNGLENLKTMVLGAGLDAALFGRMVTSDILARCDAAVHVSHALTVHRELREDDYFTAVDELNQEEQEMGAAHVNSSELTSGMFYSYVVVDVPLLVSNLTGCKVQDWADADRTLASKVLNSLVHLVATVSPGAKLGSTAPHSLAHAVLVEAGDGQPCTLANAFLNPVSMDGDSIGNAYEALAREIADLDNNFSSNKPQRSYMARGDYKRLSFHEADPGARKSLDELADWCAKQTDVEVTA
jgi:CRISPR system Cascade subunit CasC